MLFELVIESVLNRCFVNLISTSKRVWEFSLPLALSRLRMWQGSNQAGAVFALRMFPIPKQGWDRKWTESPVDRRHLVLSAIQAFLRN